MAWLRVELFFAWSLLVNVEAFWGLDFATATDWPLNNIWEHLRKRNALSTRRSLLWQDFLRWTTGGFGNITAIRLTLFWSTLIQKPALNSEQNRFVFAWPGSMDIRVFLNRHPSCRSVRDFKMASVHLTDDVANPCPKLWYLSRFAGCVVMDNSNWVQSLKCIAFNCRKVESVSLQLKNHADGFASHTHVSLTLGCGLSWGTALPTRSTLIGICSSLQSSADFIQNLHGFCETHCGWPGSGWRLCEPCFNHCKLH